MAIGRLTSSNHFGDSSFWVEAYAPTEDENNYTFLSFPVARVDMISALSEEASCLTLINGVTIPVFIPTKELRQILLQPNFKDGDTIDLTQTTGAAFKKLYKDGAPVKKISNNFNPVTERDETLAEKELIIRGFIRYSSEDYENTRVEFKDSDIKTYGPREYYKTTEIVMTFNAAAKMKNGYMRIPLPDFMKALTEAKASGKKVLDLSHETRAKDAKKLRT